MADYPKQDQFNTETLDAPLAAAAHSPGHPSLALLAGKHEEAAGQFSSAAAAEFKKERTDTPDKLGSGIIKSFSSSGDLELRIIAPSFVGYRDRGLGTANHDVHLEQGSVVRGTYVNTSVVYLALPYEVFCPAATVEPVDFEHGKRAIAAVSHAEGDEEEEGGEEGAADDDDVPEAMAASAEVSVVSEMQTLMQDLEAVSVRGVGIAQSEVKLFEDRIADAKAHATANGQIVDLMPHFIQCDDALDLLARPLPAGYRMGKDLSGRKFFINDATKQTQWNDPREVVITEASIAQLAEDFEVFKAEGISLADFFQKLVALERQMVATKKVPELGVAFYPLFDAVDIAYKPLPKDWEKRRQGADAMFRPFFTNHIAKSTSWIDPRAPVRETAGTVSLVTLDQTLARASAELEALKVVGDSKAPALEALKQKGLKMLADAMAEKRPADFLAKVHALIDDVDTFQRPLPSGWELRRDPRSGFKPFFVNHSTKSTSWKDPRGAAPVSVESVETVAAIGGAEIEEEEEDERKVEKQPRVLQLDDDFDDEKDAELKAQQRMEAIMGVGATDEDIAEAEKEAVRKEAIDRMMKAVMETGLGGDEHALEDARKQAENFAKIMAVGKLDKPVYTEDPLEQETEAQRRERLFGEEEDKNDLDDFYAKKVEEDWRKYQLNKNVTGEEVDPGCQCFYKNCCCLVM